jgi:AcrR family transcriptional regulator
MAEPISDCEVRDPRIRRTRQLLQGALRSLMQTKSFEEISVQDIAETATVNRATFYDHYTDKFALLDAMIAGGFHSLLHQREIHYDGTCPAAAGAIILAVCDYLLQSHGQCKKENAFEPLIEAAIVAAIQRVLLAGMPGHGLTADAGRELRRAGAPPPEMVASTASWAIYGAAKTWFRQLDRPAPEAVVPVILQLVLPILHPHAMDATDGAHLETSSLKAMD